MKKWINDEGELLLSTSSASLDQNKLCFVGPITGGGKIRAAYQALSTAHQMDHIHDIGNMSYHAKGMIDQIFAEVSEEYAPAVLCTSDQVLDTFRDTFWSSCTHPIMITNHVRTDYPEMNYIGLQKHLCPSDFDWTDYRNLRLSEIRQDAQKAEILLRTADVVVIDLAVLRLGDNITSKRSNIAGLHIEELCMIAKYAGASPRLRSLIINGYDQNQDTHGMMAQSVALILYYLTEGYEIRLREAQQRQEMTKYSVLPQDFDQEIIFFEDQRSKRWWVELYSDGAEEQTLIPCSRADYDEACQNVISDRLMQLLTLI